MADIPKIQEKSIHGNLLPGESRRWDLGSSTKQWRKLYVREIEVDVIATSSGSAITNADTVDGYHAYATPTPNSLLPLNAASKLPTDITGDADTLDTYHAVAFPRKAEAAAISGAWIFNDNISMGTGVTIDGTDISVHVADDDAHHDLVTAGDGIDVAGQQVSADIGTGLVFDTGEIVLDWSGDPGAVSPGATAAPGSSLYPSHTDHVHGVAVANPTTPLSVSTTDDKGSAASIVHSDHTHSIDTDSSPSDASILASDVSGRLQLTGFSIGQAVTTGQLHILSATAHQFRVINNGANYFDVDVEADGDTVISTAGSQANIQLEPAGDLILNPTGNDIILTAGVVANAESIGSSDFVSQTFGWQITYGDKEGKADFRYIYADEMHVEAFTADIYRAHVGGIIITKSRGVLSRNFTIPVGGRAIVAVNTILETFSIAGNLTAYIGGGSVFRVYGSTGNNGPWTVASVVYSSPNTVITVTGDITDPTVDGDIGFGIYFYVEDLEGFEGWQLFTTSPSDYIRLRVIDSSGGGMIVADIWGFVTSYVDLSGGEQRYVFFCTDDAGELDSLVFKGSVALDYGNAANVTGVWEATVLDSDGAFAPYSQVTTWDDALDKGPWDLAAWTTHVRIGNLDGIGGIGLEYGLWASKGTYQYILLSDSSFEVHGLDFKMYDGSNVTVRLDPSVPSIALGASAAPTGFGVGDGIWMGRDSDAAYKFRAGLAGGVRMEWDGTVVNVGDTATQHIRISGTTVKIKEGANIYTELSAGVLTLGLAGQDHVRITDAKIQFRDGADGNKVYTELDAGVLTLGYEVGGEYVTIDGTSGIEMWAAGARTVQVEASGVIRVGVAASGPYVKVSSAGMEFYSATGVMSVEIESGGTIYVGKQSSHPHTKISSAGIELIDSSGVTAIELETGGDAIFGGQSPGEANMWWNANQLKFRAGTGATQAYIDIDGSIAAGSGSVVLDTDGITIASGSSIWNKVSWHDGTDYNLYLFGSTSAGDAYAYLSSNATGIGDDASLALEATVGAGSTAINIGHYSSGKRIDLSVDNSYEVRVTSTGISIDNGLVVGDYTQAPVDGVIEIKKEIAGDPLIIFDIAGTDEWTIGVDDSDSDWFKFNTGSSLADQSIFEIRDTGHVRIYAPDANDPRVIFDCDGTTNWAMGIDDSDLDKFKINTGTSLTNPSDFEIDASGNVEINGDLNVNGLINVGAAAKLTISSAAITVTQTYHEIETEGSVATDQLTIINGGSEGDIVILRAFDGGNTVQVAQGNNILLDSAGTFGLDSLYDTIMLMYDGAKWIELSRSNNS